MYASFFFFSLQFFCRYFFPTLETDYLLCGLPVDEDNVDEDISNEDATVNVISEEITLPKSSVLIDENLRKELL